ncbi:MAG TPA: 50S ribosomal protein L1 [Nitrospirales bacterium]|nr:50S ribosomal protein L1 [Nitrospirales bacterium]HIB53746.1 50S ribosomal protein L1 [Nitrospirales bacterium]
MGKKFTAALAKVETRLYGLDEAMDLVKSLAHTKFDEMVDLAVRLGIDPRRADQMVRGTTLLPHGTGKSVRVLVFAKGEKEAEARDAGADVVGAEDLVEKIKGGWLEFDQAIATPNLMGMVGKLGKVLGPRGLMPNPKTGTVTLDVAKVIGEIRKGRAEYKTDKTGNVHVAVGKVSLPRERLCENANAILESIMKAKPASSKGRYLKGVSLSSTMGPGIMLDPVAVAKRLT